MDTKELKREIEYAETMAEKLSAHATLFDGYYNDAKGIEQAAIDPDCFFTSWNEIFEKVDELYGFLKGLTVKIFEGGDKSLAKPTVEGQHLYQ